MTIPTMLAIATCVGVAGWSLPGTSIALLLMSLLRHWRPGKKKIG